MTDALSSCVSSLRSSTSLLASSISTLDTGVYDFPRLAKVLQTTRHFELLPTTTLTTAQSALLASLTPELASLLSRAEAHLDRLERRDQALAARCDLLEGRLSHGGGSGGGEEENVGTGRGRGGGGGGREALRLKQMRARKERLEYAVERLVMQAQQRERQLRMSMAGK